MITKCSPDQFLVQNWFRVKYKIMLETLTHNHKEVEKREENILAHKEAPTTIGELQMALAEELYEMDHPNMELNFKDRKVRNEILDYWIDTEFSKFFRLLVDKKLSVNEEKQAPENPMEITLEELKRMREGVESVIPAEAGIQSY